MADPRAVVVGAGIGGLTTALCLARIGWRVVVVEREPAIEGLGAGLQVSPNASRILIDLGLGGRLSTVVFSPDAIEMRDGRTSALLSRTPLDQDRWGGPYWHIHRGDLVCVLRDAVDSDARIEVRTGFDAEDFESGATGVTVTSSAGDRLDGALLVGADGIHSAVRSWLFGHQPANFTGNVAWRGLVDTVRLPSGLVPPNATVRLGPGAHFVHYYVRGGELVNCVCVVEQASWTRESWTEPANVDEIASRFVDWAEPVPALIGAMNRDTCFKWALHDRQPMPTWGRGRVTLLGDACHPTLPFMAQGAAMAMEDAEVLARCIEREPVEPALERYATLRRARTARVQRSSRRNARVYHLGGIAARARNLVLPWAGRRTMDWLYSWGL